MKSNQCIEVNDKMQSGYSYVLSVDTGEDFPIDFKPFYTPAEMLEMGIFEGKYCNDCKSEFPETWFENAKISDLPNVNINYFNIKSRQPLSVWKDKGWIYGPDPRGWFQWYCRYYLGRRLPDIDVIQIKRWRSFSRHAGQIRANCDAGDVLCRPRQRQALLQWSHDPLI
jgi:hypothetical protein